MKPLKAFLITESTVAEKWTKKAQKFLEGPKVKSLLSKYGEELADEILVYIDGTLDYVLAEKEYYYSNLEDFKENALLELEKSESLFDEISHQYDIDFKEIVKIIKDIADLLRTIK